LLHLFALQSDEDAAVFLVEAGAAVDQVTNKIVGYLRQSI
jgi:hypothetical protein